MRTPPRCASTPPIRRTTCSSRARTHAARVHEMTTTRAGVLGAIAVVGGIVAVALIVLSRPGAPTAGAAASPSLAADTSPIPSVPAATTTASPASSVGTEPPSPTSGSPSIKGLVRVDQLGFTPDESKVAYLLASAPADGRHVHGRRRRRRRGPPRDRRTRSRTVERRLAVRPSPRPDGAEHARGPTGSR